MLYGPTILSIRRGQWICSDCLLPNSLSCVAAWSAMQWCSDAVIGLTALDQRQAASIFDDSLNPLFRVYHRCIHTSHETQLKEWFADYTITKSWKLMKQSWSLVMWLSHGHVIYTKLKRYNLSYTSRSLCDLFSRSRSSKDGHKRDFFPSFFLLAPQ